MLRAVEADRRERDPPEVERNRPADLGHEPEAADGEPAEQGDEPACERQRQRDLAGPDERPEGHAPPDRDDHGDGEDGHQRDDLGSVPLHLRGGPGAEIRRARRRNGGRR